MAWLGSYWVQTHPLYHPGPVCVPPGPACCCCYSQDFLGILQWNGDVVTICLSMHKHLQGYFLHWVKSLLFNLIQLKLLFTTFLFFILTAIKVDNNAVRLHPKAYHRPFLVTPTNYRCGITKVCLSFIIKCVVHLEMSTTWKWYAVITPPTIISYTTNLLSIKLELL